MSDHARWRMETGSCETANGAGHSGHGESLLATASQSTIVRRHQDEDRDENEHTTEGGNRP